MWKENEPYDLILMDVQMPVISGIEATVEIRVRENQEERSPIPIIALTAYSEGTEKEEMLSAGVTDYITKPIQIGSLLRILKGTIEKKPTTPESEPKEAPISEIATDTAYEAQLIEFFSDSEEALAEMLEMSLKELPQRLSAIEGGITDTEFAAAAKNCHSLANVAGILKAESLRDEAIDLERLLRSGRIAQVNPQFQRVRSLTHSLIDSFQKILRERLQP